METMEARNAISKQLAGFHFTDASHYINLAILGWRIHGPSVLSINSFIYSSSLLVRSLGTVSLHEHKFMKINYLGWVNRLNYEYWPFQLRISN